MKLLSECNYSVATARNCEGTEQLRLNNKKNGYKSMKNMVLYPFFLSPCIAIIGSTDQL